LLFYDFEVFAHDWLIVILNTATQHTHVIINNRAELEVFHAAHMNDIWVGLRTCIQPKNVI